MNIHFRRLRQDELDVERYFGIVAALVAFPLLVLLARLPADRAPVCVFHRLTALPCPACGSWRSLRLLLAGHGVEAWCLQPLMISLAGCYGLFVLYSLVTVVFNLPRLRLEDVGPRQVMGLVLVAVLAVLANWLYLISAGR